WRKRECPPSEFFQNPWWPHSRPLWDYVGRLSAAMSAGRHVAPVALYYPTEHAWTAISAGAPKAFNGMEWEAWQMSQIDHPLQKADLSLNRLNEILLSSHYDFDYIDHTLLADAAVEQGKLRVNHEHFSAIVVPAINAIGAAALSRLLAFAEVGGLVIFVNQLPNNVVDGHAPVGWTNVVEELSKLRQPGTMAKGSGRLGFVPHGDEGVVVLLQRSVAADFRVLPTAEARQFITTQHSRFVGYVETRIAPLHRSLRYHRRVLDDGQNVYFVVNESGERFDAVIELAGGNSVERWYPDSGKRRPVASVEADDGRTRLTLTVEPWDSYLFVVSGGKSQTPKPSKPVWARELDAWQLQIDGQTYDGPLASWHELGYGYFSGVATYATEFELSVGAAACERIVLDLGQVLETAIVSINGHALPPLAFAPYRVDLTPHVRSGANQLHVEVANTNTNAWEQVERTSGLLGPVSLACQSR
ncbi:MAG TPA: hypothetical protein VGN72_20850, partial [Tepidisphaeraceae bacterium]|nr:hypothetical protein [Tepidisphaeraceae bacterium]